MKELSKLESFFGFYAKRSFEHAAYIGACSSLLLPIDIRVRERVFLALPLVWGFCLGLLRYPWLYPITNTNLLVLL